MGNLILSYFFKKLIIYRLSFVTLCYLHTQYFLPPEDFSPFSPQCFPNSFFYCKLFMSHWEEILSFFYGLLLPLGKIGARTLKLGERTGAYFSE